MTSRSAVATRAVGALAVFAVAIVGPGCADVGAREAGFDAPSDTANDTVNDAVNDATPDTVSADGGAPARGEVTLVQTRFLSKRIPSATAAFVANSTCVNETVGACEIDTCPGDVGATFVSAGDVEIRAVDPPITLVRDGTRGYLGQGVTAAFYGGETVRFVATGAAGGVPAFDEGLAAPNGTPVTVTAPALGAALVVLRAAPLTAAWTGGVAGEIAYVGLHRDGTTGAGGDAGADAGLDRATVDVRCAFAVEGGTGTVPANVLARVPRGSATLSVYVAARRVFTRSAWTIAITAAMMGAHGSGAASASVTVE